MRITGADKKLIESQVRSLVVACHKVSQSHIAETSGISRVTAKRWLEEIREEQIQKI